MRYNYIAIEGNIGAGKTSLATMISEQFNGKLILEQFEDNSFLPKFYKEPDKYAFPLEMSFLAERYQQLKDQLTKQDLFRTFTISDYLFIKSLIFAKNNLQADEFALFSTMFTIIDEFLPKPDLLVYLYLDVSLLQRNIRNRGRSYEQDIQDTYLENIQNGYFEYIRKMNNMRVLIIDSNSLQAEELAESLRENRNYQVDTATNSFDAGLFAQKMLPHVILINLMAQEIDANQVCQYIRSNEDLAATKVLAIAEGLGENETSALLQKGFDAVVTSPSNTEQVAEIIKQATAIIY